MSNYDEGLEEGSRRRDDSWGGIEGGGKGEERMVAWGGGEDFKF